MLLNTAFLIMKSLYLFNGQVSIVGDFSEEEIESCILDYLGTVGAPRNSESTHEFRPILFRPSPSDLQFQQVRNKAGLVEYFHLLMLWALLIL